MYVFYGPVQKSSGVIIYMALFNAFLFLREYHTYYHNHGEDDEVADDEFVVGNDGCRHHKAAAYNSNCGCKEALCKACILDFKEHHKENRHI